MWIWTKDRTAHTRMCAELCAELDVPHWLMERVHARRRWYRVPSSTTYRSLKEYIAVCRAALATDVSVYQDEFYVDARAYEAEWNNTTANDAGERVE